MALTSEHRPKEDPDRNEDRYGGDDVEETALPRVQTQQKVPDFAHDAFATERNTKRHG